jgi:ubiquinone/menaquinone biosynthesis C-methylase UbiE
MTVQVHEMQSVTQKDFAAAPCLREGPIAPSARSVIEAARRLGNDHRAAQMRARCVPYLFENMEHIFASGKEPVAEFNRALEDLVRLLNEAADGKDWDSNSLAISGRSKEKEGNGLHDSPTLASDVREITGEHYGQLFKAFSRSSFWDEPVRLLSTRLDRNEIPVSELEGKKVLDAGCGGGRYSVAWRLLNASKVVGLDASQVGVSDARRRVAEAGLNGVDFEQGNVLGLPFVRDSFDVVFSNGVLHHTTDWQRGIHELLRVLKRGGLGWLYLIENPGGLFWDAIEILRVIMAHESRDVAREVLRLLGVPANRIFYMLDHVMVPINVRLMPAEIEQCLEDAGAIKVRRLTRGADFDRVERIYQDEPFAKLKYGVGENRYVFFKA